VLPSKAVLGRATHKVDFFLGGGVVVSLHLLMGKVACCCSAMHVGVDLHGLKHGPATLELSRMGDRTYLCGMTTCVAHRGHHVTTR
jgi:hypothetical protein